MFKKILCFIICTALSFGCASCKTDVKPTSKTESLSAEEIENLENLYGFSSIESVKYYCTKNVPETDVIYSIADIITNTGSDISGFACEILCDNKNIKTDGMNIYIPYKYTKFHKALNLTVKHTQSNVTYNFKLKFEKNWEMIFEEEFNGTSIDETKWNIWESPDSTYFYTRDSMILDGKGQLTNRVSILHEPDPTYQKLRSSGAITTKDKFASTYGYYEVRMIPHLTTGMWSAFWLVAGDMDATDAIDDDSAVNGCEIDVVETIFGDKKPSHAIHWDGYYNDQTKSFSSYGIVEAMPEVFDGNFHTFAVRWSKDEYVFLVDGKVTATPNSDYIGICNQPAYLLVSSHLGNWGGDVTLNSGEYSDTVIDYVRVYQSPNDPE